MIFNSRITVSALSIAVVTLLVSYLQPVYISQLFNDHYTQCYSPTKIADSNHNPLVCMRRIDGLKQHYEQDVRPSLLNNYVLWPSVYLNDLFGLFKNYLGTILPISVAILHLTKFFSYNYNAPRYHIRILVTMTIFMITWDLSYRYIVATISRSIIGINISGHTMLNTITIANLISMLLSRNDLVIYTRETSVFRTFYDSNIGSNIVIAMIVCLMNHQVYTCLFFHDFTDVLAGLIFVIPYYFITTYDFVDKAKKLCL